MQLNSAQISEYLHDKVVLVTGGGGSIGSELCRQIMRYRPRQLLIFDIYETAPTSWKWSCAINTVQTSTLSR